MLILSFAMLVRDRTRALFMLGKCPVNPLAPLVAYKRFSNLSLNHSKQKWPLTFLFFVILFALWRHFNSDSGLGYKFKAKF